MLHLAANAVRHLQRNWGQRFFGQLAKDVTFASQVIVEGCEDAPRI
jgi:hypothetical protein